MKTLENFEYKGIKTEQLVRNIVGTYNELPQKTRDWVAMRAVSGIIDKQLSFDSIYEYIGRMIDDRGFNYSYPGPLNRPNSPYNNSENDFKYFVNKKEANVKPAGVYFDDLIPVLNRHLNEADVRLLNQLARQSENSLSIILDVSLKEIKNNISEISDRLHQVAARFKKNGRWMVPKRPIRQVQFGPLSLTFDRRSYGGNPLAFFRQHKIYGGLGREELYHFDRGLYEALQKAGQLDEAIPEKYGQKPPLSKKKRDQIIPLHETCNGSANQAAKALGCSKTTIVKYWRREGLPIRKKIGSRK